MEEDKKDSVDLGASATSAGEMITAKLNKEEKSESASVNPLPFDLANLTREQMQIFKAMLNATPDSVRKTKQAINVRLRRIEGKIIADFKNAYEGLVEDPENRRQVMKHLIPVKFFGENDFHSILYSDFIKAEQVPCEVVSMRSEVEEIVDGEIVSRETGRLIDMVRRITHKWFKVKLPNGDVVEIEGRMANA